MNRRVLPLSLCACVLLTACGTLSYDLSAVPFAVSAKPETAPDPGSRPFTITGKSVLWLHGLAGRSQPDVGELLQQECPGCTEVTDFRVSMGASFHDWLLTHLTLGLVRMKTVTVTGVRHGGAR